jgi:molybdenum cofactor cytidylyltransferase
MQVNGNIVAFILAAGFSSRMETFKPFLPLDGSLMIERTIASFLRAGLNDVRVVIGYRAGELIPVLIRLGVRPIVNKDYPSGMYSSIQAGVQTLKKEDVAFFLLPGDIPLIRPETLSEMVLVFWQEDAGILYPTFKGRRGHPPLISARYRDLILSMKPPGGLRSVLANHERDAIEIEADDSGILIDLDTPQDYRRIL